jgi:hypothetical protein
MPVDKVSERMPWYPEGVAAMLRAGSAGYSAVREYPAL